MRNGKKSKSTGYEIVIIIMSIMLVVAIAIIWKTNALQREIIDETIDIFAENILTIILSILCSILASIVYAGMMKDKMEEDQELFMENIRKIEKDIYDENREDSIEEISQKVSEIYNQTSDMMPSRYYRSSDLPSDEFNAYLNEKIIKSQKFIFYGESARFTCKRLYKLKQLHSGTISNLKIEIFVVNPACCKIFEDKSEFLTIKEKNKNNSGNTKNDINQLTIIKNEKLKILYCLYALSKLKDSFYNIAIHLIDDVPFIDIEMTDDMIALEFFRTRSDYKRYPLTIVYENKKIYYESYEFYLECVKSKAKHINCKDLTLDYILELAKNSKLSGITENILEKYCKQEIYWEPEK